MSSNLYWEPVARKREDVPTELKLALRKIFTSGLSGIVLGNSHTGMLEGMKAAGIEDAQDLIDAIEKHDEIELTEQF